MYPFPSTTPANEDESDTASDASSITAPPDSGPDIVIPKLNTKPNYPAWCDSTASTWKHVVNLGCEVHSNHIGVVNLLSDDDDKGGDVDRPNGTQKNGLSNRGAKEIAEPHTKPQQMRTPTRCGDCTTKCCRKEKVGNCVSTAPSRNGCTPCGDDLNMLLKSKKTVLQSIASPMVHVSGKKRSFEEMKPEMTGHRLKLPKWMELRAEMLSHDGIQEGVSSMGLKNFLGFITQW